MKLLHLAPVFFLALPCYAQNPGQTDIWVGSFDDAAAAPVRGLSNITNQPGYDNQPHFAPDGTLFYASVRGERQPDIFRYDPKTGITEQITNTDDGEYSPTVMPGGGSFSVIRGSEQWLWHYGLDGNDLGAVFDGPRPVGYHAWGDERTVAMFILPDGATGTPITLQVANIETDSVEIIADSIGRSLHPVPNTNAISYVDKSSAPWWIVSLDLATMSKTHLTETRPANEDYVWTPDGSIVMGEGSELHIWRVGNGWRLLADLEDAGITNISRLSINREGDMIAVVGVAETTH